MSYVFTTGPETAEVTVEVPPGEARQARKVIARALTVWGLTHLTRSAVMVGHELVANALRHGMPPAALRLLRRDGAVVIEVGDGSPELPRIAEIDNETSTSGRGMFIVSRLARSWGVRPLPTGKVVWAELASR
ncbi:ATP-binding protein [Dactylosporangium aurantiacum]|uniref:ATP-binding protein n=1 Tax=Dactylosporangium aurantiacum TaxID=35754 RepID=A0A9Q9IFL0_9ACTN|nr:ATP-binding protein [Dactylosporangium aurantiacum]MDG6109062.1 ATP-binding protein [Dactylosporangium aurantiacum]UWZ54561.1 ATP-binding protein [Dactylosporangium aurantiacum]